MPMTKPRIDHWANWKRRLAGEKPPIVNETPEAGFYRLTFRDKTTSKYSYEPVAFFPVPGGMLLECKVGIGAKRYTPEHPGEIWNRCADAPISEQVYRAVAERGEPWPDESVAITRAHNQAPDPESFDGIKQQIEDLHREAERILEHGGVKTQGEADQASNLADRLRELDIKLEGLRKLELRPVVDQENAIRTKYQPLTVMAGIYLTLKAKIVTPWLKLQEQKRAAERSRAARTSAPPPASEQVRPSAGTRGRSQTLRKFLKGVRITDREALLNYYKDGEAMTKFLSDMAVTAIRAKIDVPGVEAIYEEKAV